MASLTDIREALAANLDSIAGVQCSAYMLTNPTPPYAEVVPVETVYDLAFGRGMDKYELTVRVLVGAVSDIGSQKRLDGFLAGSGAGSVKAAVESDLLLGGASLDLRVTKCSGYKAFGREGGVTVLGAEWHVEVYVEGES
jgi:hypothetical protein